MSLDVLVDRAGPVLLITVNRPRVRNAINRNVSELIAAAMDELDGQSDLQVGVLTGADGTFSAGMDLKAFGEGRRPSLPDRGFAGFVTRPPVKPLIAAVEGHAMGGGFEMALACDLVVAASDARFALPEARRGLLAAAGGLVRLPRRVPVTVAMELALTGETLGADRAHQLGLVNRLTAPGQARDEAIRLAEVIAANGPLAVRASKRIILESQDWTLAEAFARQHELTEPVITSADAREGALAFAEKRAPRWRGQ